MILRPLTFSAGALLALAAATLWSLAPPASAQARVADGCASIEVHNVRPQQGHLMLAAYASAESYGKQPLTAVRVPAGEATMRVQLCGLKGDVVALMLFQDLDGDGRMGRNALGMPTEPWGGSGSPGAFGPSWDNGKVALDGSTLVVKMSL